MTRSFISFGSTDGIRFTPATADEAEYMHHHQPIDRQVDAFALLDNGDNFVALCLLGRTQWHAVFADGQLVHVLHPTPDSERDLVVRASRIASAFGVPAEDVTFVPQKRPLPSWSSVVDDVADYMRTRPTPPEDLDAVIARAEAAGLFDEPGPGSEDYGSYDASWDVGDRDYDQTDREEAQRERDDAAGRYDYYYASEDN